MFFDVSINSTTIRTTTSSTTSSPAPRRSSSGRKSLLSPTSSPLLLLGAVVLLFTVAAVVLPSSSSVVVVSAFSPAFVSIPKTTRKQVEATTTLLAAAAKGFGASGSGSSSSSKKNKKKKATSSSSAAATNKPKPYVKSEQDALLEQLLAQTSQSVLGRAVAESREACQLDEECDDPFWELIPSLISSRFPNVRDDQLERVAGFIRHTLNTNLPLEEPEIINNKWRPESEIHAYMPGLGPTKPFYDDPTSQLELCKLLEDNYDIIKQEYLALMDDINNGGEDRFQSVTSMNYDSGWKTLVLFYNGHRIPGFPYHLCPTTTRILETVPLAGRIAGFNRQQPNTGIPLHTDGNNMWLTTQMGICCPTNPGGAHIRVGPDTRYYEEGKCLLYDTTYEHETFNENLSQERVVLHVDFFNILQMTPIEIEVLQYIYHLREEFMKAEGVSKVGEHIL